MSAVLNTFDNVDFEWNSTFNNPGDHSDHGAEEHSGHAHHVTLAVLSLTILLGLSVTIGQVVHRYNVHWLSEAGSALIVGISVGIVLEFAPLPIEFEGVFQFSTQFFFIALLPPILFDAAFNLKTRTFFSNLGAILLLAFAGTITSTIVIAVFMYTVGQIGLSYKISFFNSSMFGAIISATDPVTILSVFRRLQVNKDLKALIFGESVLNDSVSIVLYRVISTFSNKSVTFGGVMYGIYTFFKIFLGSVAVGALFGMGAAYVFKTRYFRNEHTSLEASLVIIFAYCSFYLADGVGFSGIVSIVVCGIMMAQYVRPNLNSSTNDRVGSFFSVLSSLAENFVFIYIGFALFTESSAWSQGLTWSFVVFCAIALALSRAANVYPNMMIINYFRPEEMAIPRNHMFMSWFSGMRGAMAFALAMLGRDKLGEAGDVIVAATFFMVLITVLVNGGAASYVTEYLCLRDSQGYGGISQIPGSDKMQFINVTSHGDSDLHSPTTIGVGASTHGASMHGNSLHGKAMAMREKIHEFQRTGGITEHFRQLDKTLGRALVNTTPAAPSLGHGHVSHGPPTSPARSSPGGYPSASDSLHLPRQ